MIQSLCAFNLIAGPIKTIRFADGSHRRTLHRLEKSTVELALFDGCQMPNKVSGDGLTLRPRPCPEFFRHISEKDIIYRKDDSVFVVSNVIPINSTDGGDAEVHFNLKDYRIDLGAVHFEILPSQLPTLLQITPLQHPSVAGEDLSFKVCVGKNSRSDLGRKRDVRCEGKRRLSFGGVRPICSQSLFFSFSLLFFFPFFSFLSLSNARMCAQTLAVGGLPDGKRSRVSLGNGECQRETPL